MRMDKNASQLEGELAKRFLELIQNGHDGNGLTLLCASPTPVPQWLQQNEEELAREYETKNNVLTIKDELAKRFLEAVQNGHEGGRVSSLVSNVPPFPRHK